MKPEGKKHLIETPPRAWCRKIIIDHINTGTRHISKVTCEVCRARYETFIGKHEKYPIGGRKEL